MTIDFFAFLQGFITHSAKVRGKATLINSIKLSHSPLQRARKLQEMGNLGSARMLW